MSFTRADWDLFNDTHGLTSRLLDEDKECLLKWVLDDSLPDGHVLEVGCAFAGTSAALIRANHYARGNTCRVYCVDPYPEITYCKLGSLSEPNPVPLPPPVPWVAPLLHLHNALKLLQEFGPVHIAGTTACLRELIGQEKPRFRMVFIDGDHSYEGVLADFDMTCKLVQDGGVIILHDCTETQPGVLRFWEERVAQARGDSTCFWQPQGVQGYCGVLRCE